MPDPNNNPTEEKEEDKYALDGLDLTKLSEEDIKNHRFSRKWFNRLEIAAVIGILSTPLIFGAGYALYKLKPLPQPVQQYFDSTIEQITSSQYKNKSSNS